MLKCKKKKKNESLTAMCISLCLFLVSSATALDERER